MTHRHNIDIVFDKRIIPFTKKLSIRSWGFFVPPHISGDFLKKSTEIFRFFPANRILYTIKKTVSRLLKFIFSFAITCSHLHDIVIYIS